MKIKKFIFFILNKFSWFYYNLNYSIYSSKYDIHKSFNYNGKGILFHGDGAIIIEENSYLGRHSYFQATKTKKIHIGKNVSISHFVYIYTKSSIANQDFNNKNNIDFLSKEGNVTIGNHCWIGAKVFINPGISIGENAVVGANSVVTKSLPPNSISAGVPAKVLSFKKYVKEDELKHLANQFSDVLSDSLKFKLGKTE